jgi:acyl-CoA synthetase (AMP-forming)/AMP-acid ligase II
MNTPVDVSGPPPGAAGATRPRWSPEFESATIWQLIRGRAERTPHARLVIDEHDHAITFGEFRDAAERLAAGLADRGVRAEDVVSWQLPSRIDTMILTAALSRLGVVQNPLIMMLREPEVEFICGQAKSRLLVVTSHFRGYDHAGMAHAVAGRLPGLDVLVVDDGLPTGDPATLPPEPEPDQQSEPLVRWLFYTSGTTAEPKGAQHTDRGLLAASATFCESLAPTAADRIASLAPIAHVGGILHILSALAVGSSLVITAVFDPASTPEQLSRQQVTLGGSGVPFIRVYLQRQRAQPDSRMFPQARAWLVGGSPRPASLHHDVKNELGGVGIVSGYGLTECPYVSWGHVGDSDHGLATTEGRPRSGTEVVIVRADGSHAGPGEVGELRVRAPQLTVGYVDSALDADAFDSDGFFRTGDLAFVDEHGAITITGRIKDVIIRNMENISAREVEDRLADYAGISDVAVVGLPDPVTGERVCAVVVPARPEHPPTLDEVCAHLTGKGLNVRKLPVQLEVVDELPRNAMAKVVKVELRRRFGA